MDHKVMAPPKLLLGASLLFWGAMTERPFIGLLIALLIESANWLPFRWSFTNKAYSLAWRISIILTIIFGIIIWLEGDRYTAAARLITWFPALLLPIQLVQLFGFANAIEIKNLSFFSNLSRRREIPNLPPPSSPSFNFGNAYFIITLLSASLGYYAQHIVFYPFLAILSSCLIFYRLKRRMIALLMIMIFAASAGLGGQIGMSTLYRWITNRDTGSFSNYDKSPTISKTSIGSLGEIKQSPEIFWRLNIPSNTIPPNLLRIATYNRYKGPNWQNTLPGIVDEKDSFRGLSNLNPEDKTPIYPLSESTFLSNLDQNLPTFEIRGRSASEKPLPLPGNTVSLENFDLDAVEINPHGSVRVLPKRSIIDGFVRWNQFSTPESQPSQHDLEIDPSEIDGITEVASRLGLKDLPSTSAKVARIRQFFTSEFEYSRYLTIPPARASRQRPTAIETFLTKSKRGHCEYFATSATLLLRAAGVPSRYSVGFTVSERKSNSNQWLIRGTHGHAWTRVWDEEKKRWFDFDCTPSSWLASETSGSTSKTQWFSDTLQCLREDFFVWRNKPTNRLIVTILMWSVAISICTFVGRRLWKSRVSVPSTKLNQMYGNSKPIHTPLHDLEPIARKILNPRKPFETLPTWLYQLKNHGITMESLNQALEIHQRLRFDPSPQNPSLLQQLAEVTNKIRQQISQKKFSR